MSAFSQLFRFRVFADRTFSISKIIGLSCLFCSIATSAEMSPKELYARIRPSVVLIITSDEHGKDLAQGSGFVVGNGKQIVTNFHVVRGASGIRIKTFDGSEKKISYLLGYDSTRDLAVLLCELALPPIPIAQAKPEVGDSIVAIGNPEGLEASLSQGLISGIRETGESIYYQISASISPGSSGGPIINERGEVIAVSTFTFKEGQNLNFGVPTLFVRPLIEKTGTLPISTLAKPAESKTTPGTTAASTLHEISQLVDDGLYSLALKKGLAALKDNENNLLFVLFLSNIAVNAEEYDTATSLFEKALALKPNDDMKHMCWVLLGETYAVSGKYEQALRAFNNAEPEQSASSYGICQMYFLIRVASGDDEGDVAAKKLLSFPKGRTYITPFIGLSQAAREQKARKELLSFVRYTTKSGIAYGISHKAIPSPPSTPIDRTTLQKGDKLVLPKKCNLYFRDKVFREGQPGEVFEVYGYRPNEKKLYILTKNEKGQIIVLNIPDSEPQ